MSFQDNPYASPSYAVDSFPAQPVERPRASRMQRFGTWFIDQIVIQVLGMGAGFVLGVVMAIQQISAHGQITPEANSAIETAGFFVGILIALLYFIVMEAFFQRTVGKLATGTIVVDMNGNRPTFGQIVGRTLARFIPFEAFSFLAEERPQGWHDSISKTQVLSLR